MDTTKNSRTAPAGETPETATTPAAVSHPEPNTEAGAPPSVEDNPGTTPEQVGGQAGQHGNKSGKPGMGATATNPGTTTDKPGAPPSVEDIARELQELDRRRRRMIARGVSVVLAPPFILCIPFIVLKACGLLCVSWWWCFAPLLLLLIPFAAVVRSYRAARRVFGERAGDNPGGKPNAPQGAE